MPSASKMSTPVAVDLEVIQGRYALLGGYTGGVRDLQAGRRPCSRCSSACPTTAASVSIGAWSPRGRSRSGGPIGRRLTWPATRMTCRLAICPGRGRHVGRRVQPQRGPR